jgi:hypothetical protein
MSEQKRWEVHIDITSWVALLKGAEIEIDEETLVDLVVTNQFSTADMGRMAVAARHLGLSDETILKANSLLLQAGARAEVQSKITRRTIEGRNRDGEIITARRYVSSPGREAIGLPRTYDDILSEGGTDRAVDWLYRWISSNVYARLAQISVAGGDVRAVADGLIERIEDIVSRLT